jgi:methyl-accepting chemotaxis protein
MKKIKIKFLLPLSLSVVIAISILGFVLLSLHISDLHYDHKNMAKITTNQVVSNFELVEQIHSFTKNSLESNEKVIELAKKDLKLSQEIKTSAETEVNENIKRQLKLFQMYIKANSFMFYNSKLEDAMDQMNKGEIYNFIMNDSEIIEFFEKIREFTNYIGVEEIHISDPSGILTYTNAYDVEGMVGFNFAESTQAAPFMEALTNKDFILIQDVFPRGVDGKPFQYTGIARLDRPGIVQIGFQPEDLGQILGKIKEQTKNLEVLENEIDTQSKGLKEMSDKVKLQGFIENTIVTENGLISLLDKEGKVISHTDKNEVGEDHSDLTYYKRMREGELKEASYKNENYFIYSEKLDDNAICVLIPKNRYTRQIITTVIVTASGVLLIAAIIILLSLLLSHFLIIKPVYKLKSTVKQISGGNLDVGAYTGTKDEIGELSQGIDGLVNRFSQVIYSVKESSKGFVRATTEIASGNQDLSQRTSEEASNLEETAAAIDEISKTTSHNTNNSDKAKQLTEDIKISMTDLEESSNKMKEIIQVIEDIAFRTNLLALNASIEAARAGEAGKGFEVVATEVKELSQQSSLQAKEIVEIVGESINKIRENARLIDKIVDVVNNISITSNEQNNKMKEINNAIDQLNQVTQRNAALVEESASASEEISTGAKEINNLISYFKISTQNKGLAGGEVKDIKPVEERNKKKNGKK